MKQRPDQSENPSSPHYRIILEASHEYQTNPGVRYDLRRYDVMPDRYHAQVRVVEKGWFGKPIVTWETIATTRDVERYKEILEARIEDHRRGRLIGTNGSRVVATYVEQPMG